LERPAWLRPLTEVDPALHASLALRFFLMWARRVFLELYLCSSFSISSQIMWMTKKRASGRFNPRWFFVGWQ
jgi:hypothetical protein